MRVERTCEFREISLFEKYQTNKRTHLIAAGRNMRYEPRALAVSLGSSKSGIQPSELTSRIIVIVLKQQIPEIVIQVLSE